jgi:hypothetical protein
MSTLEFLNKFLVEVDRPEKYDTSSWTRYDFVDVYECKLEVYAGSLEDAVLVAQDDPNYNWEEYNG